MSILDINGWNTILLPYAAMLGAVMTLTLGHAIIQCRR